MGNRPSSLNTRNMRNTMDARREESWRRYHAIQAEIQKTQELRAKARKLGDEFYQLTVDDGEWEAFWETISEGASNEEIIIRLELAIAAKKAQA